MSFGRQYPPPDVKSWTTFFTNFYFRRAATSRRKSLIFLDIPPFFSLAVYFFALIFIFTADDLGSSPFSIIKESSFNLFLCCAISLQDSISIFSKNPAYLWFFHQKQKFDPTCHQQPGKIGVKNALRFLLKKTKIFNFRASDTLFPLPSCFLLKNKHSLKVRQRFIWFVRKITFFTIKKLPPATQSFL